MAPTTHTRKHLHIPGYEKVVYFENPSVGLAAFVAIHSTALGPACGGIRMLPYATPEEALDDVLRLAKGMSYKSALAGIGFGGGKSVIIQDPLKKTRPLFEAFGDFIHSFEGRYISAKDMNISSDDLKIVKSRTPHALGIEGEPGSSGDPSPVTARGLFRALEATVEHLTGKKDLSGIKVAIQGVGHVGFPFAEAVHKAGGEIWVSDLDKKALAKAEKKLGAKVVTIDEMYDLKVDVFSPCARGAILNTDNIRRLKCRAVVGAANNQLASEEHGSMLHKRGILYAPDFSINAGGIINIFVEYEGYEEAKALQKADGIYHTLKEIFSRSKQDNVPPAIIADKLAEERLYAKKR
jgi:leucine dehydrogenase